MWVLLFQLTKKKYPLLFQIGKPATDIIIYFLLLKRYFIRLEANMVELEQYAQGML